VIFGVFFRAFKQFLGFSRIVFALKIISKKRKNYPTGTGRARRPDPLRPARARAGPAAWPARDPSARGRGSHGAAAPGRARVAPPCAPRPYIGGPASPSRSPLPRAASPPAQSRHRRRLEAGCQARRWPTHDSPL
jgi:hypothetical protein